MPDQRFRGYSYEDTPSDEPMIPLHEMWHNGGKRLLGILIVISCLILLLCAGVALGIFVLDTRIKGLTVRVGVVEGDKSLAENQADIRRKVDANTVAITDYQNAINESWKKFQEHNPTQPVPQITEPSQSSDGKSDVIVIPAKSKPTPAPKPKTRTVIRYKKQPTPKPWWQR